MSTFEEIRRGRRPRNFFRLFSKVPRQAGGLPHDPGPYEPWNIHDSRLRLVGRAFRAPAIGWGRFAIRPIPKKPAAAAVSLLGRAARPKGRRFATPPFLNRHHRPRFWREAAPWGADVGTGSRRRIVHPRARPTTTHGIDDLRGSVPSPTGVASTSYLDEAHPIMFSNYRFRLLLS